MPLWRPLCVLTRKTWSKMAVGLSIWPRMTIISLSMYSLNSRRLHVICISSSVRILKRERHTHTWRQVSRPRLDILVRLSGLTADCTFVQLHFDLTKVQKWTHGALVQYEITSCPNLKHDEELGRAFDVGELYPRKPYKHQTKGCCAQ